MASRRSRTRTASTASRCPTRRPRSRSLAGSGPRVDVHQPDARLTAPFEAGALALPKYELGGEEATRRAYGDALGPWARRGDVVALDGEVGNSTYARDFQGGLPGPLLRDVHRRAADGRGRGRPPGPRLAPFATTSPPSSPGPTTSCGWRRSRGPTSAGRLARRGVDRRGWASQMALEDLASLRACREHGPLPVGPEPDRAPGRGDGGPRGDLLPAHDARGPR